MIDLQNKVVLITGATSGIGKACAEIFASHKCNLILLARRVDVLQEVADSLSQQHGVKIHAAACDVRNRTHVEDVIEALPPEFSTIEILVNNAGLSRGLSKLHDGDVQDWEEMIDTNVKGLLYVSRVVLQKMIAQHNGMIINIASIAGRQAYPNGNVYCATKSAVKALSETMQFDVNGSGVRVCNIDPGMVETEFSIVRFHGDTERANSVYNEMTPLHAHDVAEAVLFCATRPKHVSVHDMLLMPTDQASTQVVFRR